MDTFGVGSCALDFSFSLLKDVMKKIGAFNFLIF